MQAGGWECQPGMGTHWWEQGWGELRLQPQPARAGGKKVAGEKVLPPLTSWHPTLSWLSPKQCFSHPKPKKLLKLQTLPGLTSLPRQHPKPSG